MPDVFYGNFDFEHELASSAYNRSKRLERLNAEVTAHLLALVQSGDYLFYPCEPPMDFLRNAEKSGFPEVRAMTSSDAAAIGLSVVPWGWSKPVHSFAKLKKWQCDAPSSESVARANSREFSFGCEQSQFSAIPGQAVVGSLESLESAILNASAVWSLHPAELSWLLKAQFSMSGRERLSCRGTCLDDSSRNWIVRRLKSGERLFFEPRVAPLFELSTQWCLPQSGSGLDIPYEPELLGVTQLLTDRAGQYLGSVLLDETVSANAHAGIEKFYPSLAMFDRVVTDARSVGVEAQRLGYHGPLGIDAMFYRGPDGETAVRTILDVNARLTMGRIALEWFRRFTKSERPAWLLVPDDWLRDKGLAPTPANSTRRLTSPRSLAGQPVRRVGVLFTEQADWQSLLSTYL